MAGNRAPTIYDVARAAGVAASTVSRALSRPGRVAPGTVERIRAAAHQLGYRTNPLARALPTGRSRMLAMVVEDLACPYTAELLRGAQAAAGEAGYTTVLADARDAPERVLATVDGALVAAPQASDDAVLALAARRPVVLAGRALPGLPGVVPDIGAGIHQLVAHLAALGHKAVTYVAGPPGTWADTMRRRALRQAGTAHGVQSHRIGPFPGTLAGGVAAAGDLLWAPTSAVIACDDLVAAGVVRALTARGIAVPAEISVVGFGNVPAAALVGPGLTTVATPLRLMGDMAVRHLVALAEGTAAGDPAPLPVKLTVRGSTAPPRPFAVPGFVPDFTAATSTVTRPAPARRSPDLLAALGQFLPAFRRT